MTGANCRVCERNHVHMPSTFNDRRWLAADHGERVCGVPASREDFLPMATYQNMKTRRPLFLMLVLLSACASAAAADTWRPLWDGKSLAGWHVIGKGEWKIIDGALRGTHAKEEKEFGHLVTDKAYRDFTVRL